MSEYAGAERRLVFRLLDYWERRKQGRRFPALEDIRANELGEDWQWCVVISLGNELDEPRFKHVGSFLWPEGLGEIIDTPVKECPKESLLKHATAFYPRVLELGVPVSIGGECGDGEGRLLYRSTLMPLSSDGEFVDALFGGANCRRVIPE